MKSLILFIVAIVLGTILIPLSFLYAIVTILLKSVALNFKWKYPKTILFSLMLAWFDYQAYFKNCAISIDQVGNTIGYKLFNDLFIKKYGHKFGNPDETISSVLGKNKLQNKLSIAGKILDWILNKLDPGHSIKSIEK